MSTKYNNKWVAERIGIVGAGLMVSGLFASLSFVLAMTAYGASKTSLLPSALVW